MAKVDINNLLAALQMNNEQMKKYVYDTITHITPTAVNVARILSHMANTTIHITREDKELWNSSYERAKEYMDRAIAQMSSIDLITVPELPESNISSSSIYLLETDAENVYEQYIWSNGEWKSLGKTSVDMEDFYTKDQIDQIINSLRSTSKHTHSNKDILDMTTAAFTLKDKETLNVLKNTDLPQVSSHMKDAGIHLNAQDKSVLQSLLEAGMDTIKNHLEDTGIHLSPEEKTKYDNYLETIKTYISEQLSTVMNIQKVNTLPPANDAVNNTLYLVPAQLTTSGVDNIFDEWLFIGGGYEKIGTGGSSTSSSGSISEDNLAILSEQIKQAILEELGDSSHSHTNKTILDQITVAFTTDLLQSMESTANSLLTHVASNDVHLSSEQIALINSISSLDSTLETKINKAVRDLLYGDNEDGDISGTVGNFTSIIYTISLPSANIDKQAIYFVKKIGIQLPESSENPDGNALLRATNYDKYVWSDETGGWEQLGAIPVEFVDELPTDTSIIRHGIIYCVPSSGSPSTSSSTEGISIACEFNKYIWNATSGCWEVIFETTELSADDINYILAK